MSGSSEDAEPVSDRAPAVVSICRSWLDSWIERWMELSMRFFFTGATGAIGRETVPRLLEAGHEVRAVACDSEGQDWLAGIGAEPVIVDLFDRAMVNRALIGAEAVFSFVTVIPSLDTMTKRKPWEMNYRLRSRATRYLVDGAMAAGAGRFIQESITFFYCDGGMPWLDESASIAPVWGVLD